MLTAAMAWLLAERAVLNGEISRYTLSSREMELSRNLLFTDALSSDNVILPPKLRSLFDRSRSIYSRLLRLDDMVRQSTDQSSGDWGTSGAEGCDRLSIEAQPC